MYYPTIPAALSIAAAIGWISLSKSMCPSMNATLTGRPSLVSEPLSNLPFLV